MKPGAFCRCPYIVKTDLRTCATNSTFVLVIEGFKNTLKIYRSCSEYPRIPVNWEQGMFSRSPGVNLLRFCADIPPLALMGVPTSIREFLLYLKTLYEGQM